MLAAIAPRAVARSQYAAITQGTRNVQAAVPPAKTMIACRNVGERIVAEAAAIAKNPNAAISKQPKTMAQADATLFRTKSGGSAVRVPTELWSTLGVAKDADGNVQLTESEGEAPTTKVEGLPNE